jgi:hypothetical protein
MSVPTHNLYDYIHQATKKQFLLRYFYPYSTKNLANLICHVTDKSVLLGPNSVAKQDRYDSRFLSTDCIDYKSFVKMQPVLLCHDQEPLHYELFGDSAAHMKDFFAESGYNQYIPYINDLNLRWCDPWSAQQTWTLLHSELNSSELARYEATGQYKGAYWWSHAMLALDWYRYAEHDLSLKYTDSYDKLFLVYCRDQTGSRAYRKDFMQQITALGLAEHCQTQSIAEYTTTPTSSAEYESTDFNCTAISVVLETVFDSRIHLTEKTLRPLACAHPFVLAAGPGSLGLLRRYGFETFDPYINESYDLIEDSADRLAAITAELKRISLLSAPDQQALIAACNRIARKNQQRFFSKGFRDYVTEELQNNVDAAFDYHRGQLDLENWWKNRKWHKKVFRPQSSALGYQMAALYRKQRLLNNR